MRTIRFTKMHGAGNDYIYIDCTADDYTSIDMPELSRRMTPRHTAVGADGIILITLSDKADFGMRMFNPDGSEAEMCGNGSRCVGKYAYDHHLTRSRHLTLETRAGIKTLHLQVDPASDKVHTVTVDMGHGVVKDPCVKVDCKAFGRQIEMTSVDVGNPHAVTFIDDVQSLEIDAPGYELEHLDNWPDRANIEFARIIDDKTIEMRVWERGTGETLACGTGACATAIAAIATGRCKSNTITVKLPGGDLIVTVSPDDNRVSLTGAATEVYQGNYPVDDGIILS